VGGETVFYGASRLCCWQRSRLHALPHPCPA
jgi:hypothetical protein